VAQQEPQVGGGYGAEKKRFIFHDAWNEYAVIARKEDKFCYSVLDCTTMGLSRLTMASTLNFLTIDALFLTGL
jgi:hypothetical protein